MLTIISIPYFLIITYALCKCGEAYKIDSEDDATHYLSKFGYLSPSFNSSVESKSTFLRAVSRFQKFSGLNSTGQLDPATMLTMNKPRCGNPDMVMPKVLASRRKKSFTLSEFRWRKKTLTYRVTQYPNFAEIYEWQTESFTARHVDTELKLAFSYWGAASGLKFSQVNSNKVDIDISFLEGAHGGRHDREFDGPGFMIAHAFSPDPLHPLHGDIHFDGEEPWNAGQVMFNSFHFRWAAIHEIGHALGLEHSDDNTSYMYPIYPVTYDPAWPLHKDDINGIQALYGRMSRIITSKLTPETSSPKPKTQPHTGKNHPRPTPDPPKTVPVPDLEHSGTEITHQRVRPLDPVVYPKLSSQVTSTASSQKIS